MAIFVLVIDIAKKALEYIFYIQYLVLFNNVEINILRNSGSKFIVISPSYIKKLSFKIWKINVKVQKINSSTLVTFWMGIPKFQIKNKVKRPKFFQKIFSVMNTEFQLILEKLFLKISNLNILFSKKHLSEGLILLIRSYQLLSRSKLSI